MFASKNDRVTSAVGKRSSRAVFRYAAENFEV